MLKSVDIIGAGPAGLYTAILMRRYLPHVQVRVTEQNPEGATFGFGVVFSDQALAFLKADDPETYALIVPHMEAWQNMTLNLPKDQVTLDGVGFTSIGRLELIEILKDRARSLGVDIRFDTYVSNVEELDADLVIGADGLNSIVRHAMPESFKPTVQHFDNHFAWFGAEIPFDTLTQTFIETALGPMNAHHYRFSKNRSTFIVECDQATFNAFGFEKMDEVESAELCSKLFKDALKGTKLITNNSMWRQFPRLWCQNWVAGRYVLLGDAVHTAHFSIGSGTRLALEDAIALVQALKSESDVDHALQNYQEQRQPIAKKIVDAANTSAVWYDSFGSKMSLPPLEFAYDYMARSGRIDRTRMRSIAPEFVTRYEAEIEGKIRDPLPKHTATCAGIGYDKTRHANCSEILWQNLDRNPEKSALVGPHGTISYRDLIAEAGKWGNAFTQAGLKQNERIAFFLDDTPTFPAAFFGAVRAGFVPVLLNTQTKTDLLQYFIEDSGARNAVVDAAFAGTFEHLNLETIVVANGEIELDNAKSAAEFLSDQDDNLEAADTGPDDMAFWMYSSGSTGRPKGIVHLHHDATYIHQSYGEHILKLTSDDICYSVPKAYFAYGFGNSFIFPFSVGATSLLMPGQPRPDVVLEAIEAYKPSILFGLPTLYTALARHHSIDERDLSSLRQSMSAAEILSQDIYDAWKQKVGHGPTEGLGSTEMLHIYLSNTLDDHRIGAAGAVVPGYEVRLEDEHSNEVKPGEEGAMLVRGHSSSPMYWNRPDKTKETMRGEWLYTGDLFVEKDGYYYFQGRADELIKVSGQWVWPMEVERCLNEHPDINECAVLAHQLEDKRMALKAFVSLVGDKQPSDLITSSLREHVKLHLTPYKSPRLFDFVEDLPKTGTGKIDRQALIASSHAVSATQ